MLFCMPAAFLNQIHKFLHCFKIIGLPRPDHNHFVHQSHQELSNFVAAQTSLSVLPLGRVYQFNQLTKKVVRIIYKSCHYLCALPSFSSIVEVIASTYLRPSITVHGRPFKIFFVVVVHVEISVLQVSLTIITCHSNMVLPATNVNVCIVSKGNTFSVWFLQRYLLLHGLENH